MNRIRARLKHTSQSWIASIILVLNLVKLAGMAVACLGFSAQEKLNLAFHDKLSVILTVFKTKSQSKKESGLALLTYAA
jgi:transposase, IS5 family